MHKVKCAICGIIFDRDKEPAEMINSRRYAHAECYQKAENSKSKEEKDYEALEKYILKLFNKTTLGALITKQIRDFKKNYNYTYSGMQKTLMWWFEIKGNTIDQTNGGIGIIPFVYEDACKYFYSLYLAQLASQTIPDEKPEVIEIEIAPPQVRRKPPKLFNF